MSAYGAYKLSRPMESGYNVHKHRDYLLNLNL